MGCCMGCCNTFNKYKFTMKIGWWQKQEEEEEEEEEEKKKNKTKKNIL